MEVSTQQGVVLTPEYLKSFDIAAIFPSGAEDVTSMDFYYTGMFIRLIYVGAYCAVTTANDEIKLYDATYGKERKTLGCQANGCSNIKFTHHQTSVLASCTKQDIGAIEYISLHDNRCLCKFVGHKDHICAAIRNDYFITGGSDEKFLLWDLREKKAVATGKQSGTDLHCLLDPNELVIEVITATTGLSLIDIRNIESGAFSTYPLSKDTKQVLSFETTGFNDNVAIGKEIIKLGVTNYVTQVMETLHGGILRDVDSSATCFVPQTDYLLASGSKYSSIDLIDISGSATDSSNLGTVGNMTNISFMKFSPEQAMFVTCGKNVAFWIPKQTD